MIRSTLCRRERLLVHLARKVFRGLGHIVDEFGVRYPKTLASLIGRRSDVRVRGQQDELVRPKSQPLEFGMDQILKSDPTS